MMEKFLCLAALAAAAATVENPALILQNANGVECEIKWDGTDLTIPQHTAVLANHTAEIAALKTQVGTMSTKLDNLHDFVHAALHDSPLSHHLNGTQLCPNGVIDSAAHTCTCGTGYTGGGPWVEGSASYPPCAVATSIYTFEVAVSPSTEPQGSIGLHIDNVQFTGASGSASVVQPVAGDYCTNSALRSARNDVSFNVLVDDTDTTWACNIKPSAGTVAFRIQAPTGATGMVVKYARPLYAPGWKILRDGVAILTESANRGSAQTPSPISYTYTW